MNLLAAISGVGLVVGATAWAVQPAPSPRGAIVGRPASGRSRAFRRTLRVGLPAAIATLVGGAALGGAVLVAQEIRRRLAPRRAARRARVRIAADLPDAVDLFVLAVGAGLTPRQAIEQLAERGPPSVRPGFAEVVARTYRGAPLHEALHALDDLLGAPAVALSALVGSAERHGLPLAAVLERLAAESRATRRRLDEAAARALPVRLSFPLVVCTLPSFVLLAIVPPVMAALSSLGADAW